ncbi:anti-phage dCTP deaminase [Burkholderia thailandensis]|uniref:anti-phage dCTP deaminase n=1 Tax=Burkholderia thailandensis TaxID=57975 RepID=UPI0022AC414E|nr:anti-phage dCTP deaminase [Burkholderia thailandensis]MCZ2903404.1 deaminase [Burkholderia thailandensis]MDD1484238.1 deoxycytidylate deaminase [Burkholderia thailandensis]MDD1490438.1 deoxycytidylate deaminase [Burkholderia thailandensis]MDD1496393.1 deoxycytidylate deaminase [Burkholderia thailandensis]
MNAQPASQIVNFKRASDSRANVKQTQTEELVIALCGPIGSPIKRVGQEIGEILKHDYGYDVEIIRLSEFLSSKAQAVLGTPVDDSSEFKRINGLIECGNQFRDQYGERVLAELAIYKIIFDRIAVTNKDESPRSRRKCYIIDSIKNNQELEIFRLVYSEILFFVGVFSSPEQRAKNLEDTGMTSTEVYTLIDRDSGEEIAHGQTVSDTFPKADFFIRAEDNSADEIKNKVERFINLLFEGSVITPHRNEAAMYAAWSAASNSACLSRQVGAAIADAQGHILSVGWNDVPKVGGGLYLSDDAKDKRCWNSGEKCYNDHEKAELAKIISAELIKSGFVEGGKKAQLIESIKSNSRLKGLIEFSRAVHAEMHAIINAGYISGSKILGSSLYCTTYPCHSCARHIIAAGVKEIYYIEPYRKSLATKLHSDALTENSSDMKKVRILAYEGVAPRRFLELFEMGSTKRKESGKLIKVSKSKRKPRHEKSLEALYKLEALVTQSLKKQGLVDSQEGDHDEK